jgi:probable F420-dependent oxidoreductase
MLDMKYAIAIPQLYSDGEFDPDAFCAYFVRAEELGFESAWAQDGLLGPAHQLAPLETMAFAAACTSRIRLGCSVLISTLHTPVHLARSVSALDQLSRGRIEVGVGTGGKARPFAAFGMDPEHYVTRFTEGLALMKRLWTEPRVTFDGQFWQLEDAPLEPKPFQKPFPPLWIGAHGPKALERAVRIGSGFFGAGSAPTATFATQVGIVKQALAEWGSPDRGFRIAKRVYIAVGADPDRERERLNDGLERLYGRRVAAIEAAGIAGRPDECARELREVAAAGAELILFTPLSDLAAQAELLAAEVIPQIG